MKPSPTNTRLRRRWRATRGAGGVASATTLDDATIWTPRVFRHPARRLYQHARSAPTTIRGPTCAGVTGKTSPTAARLPVSFRVAAASIRCRSRYNNAPFRWLRW